MGFTETSCMSAANLQFCCYWFLAACSWSVKKLTANYENTCCTVCPHLPCKPLHKYAQKFGTSHGRVTTVVHFSKKPKTERGVSKSLKIGTAYKTRMRWQMSLQRLVVLCRKCKQRPPKACCVQREGEVMKE